LLCSSVVTMNRSIICLAIGLGLLGSGCGQNLVQNPFQKPSPTPTPTVTPTTSAVSAIGRLEPEGEVIRVSVPNAQDSRVNQLLVKEGDRVQADQVIAILQGVDRRQADLQDAAAIRRLRQAELKKAEQGEAKASSILAQKATIGRLQCQVETQTEQRQAAIANAEAVLAEAVQNYQRRERLVEQGAIAKAELEIAARNQATAAATLREKKADLAEAKVTLQAQIQEEQAKLAELKEIRPVDVEIAQAQLEQADVTVQQRQADLGDVQVRAPLAGQILRINTKVGEQVNTAQGIVELARTDRMFVVAEIAEADIGQVKLGQMATIVTDYGGFGGEVSGTVAQVGLQIGRRTMSDGKSNSTLQDNNARIVEVKIRVAPQDNFKVNAFTGMQVRVKIDTTAANVRR
jgi:HlyD family secretion protein